jgi:uncharacterized protein with HEPN domain
MDKKSERELLEYILFSVGLIRKRFNTIKTADDFLENEEGLEKLDAISMRLQTIGEALKNLLKRDPQSFYQIAPKEYWSEIVKAREIISHHYVDLDAHLVYDICENELPILKRHIERILHNKEV